MTNGAADLSFNFGPSEAGWLPVTGDWNGGGSDRVGLFKDGLWLLSNSLPARSDVGPFRFGQTQSGWLPVAGDWDKNGSESIGVYKNSLWQLRNNNNNGSPDIGYATHVTGVWYPIASYRGDLSVLEALSQPIIEPSATLLPTSTSDLTPEAATPTPTLSAEVTVEVTPEANEETGTPELVVTTEIPPTPTVTVAASSTPEPATQTSVPTSTPLPASEPEMNTSTPEPIAESTEETG